LLPVINGLDVTKTILIISSDKSVTYPLTLSLQDIGYTPVVEPVNDSAIKTAAAIKPDLILLDISEKESVPDTVKHLTLWFNNPIIVLSATNQESNIVQALDQGASDYIVKPFRMPEVMARVRLALRLNRKRNDPRLDFGRLSIDFANRLVKINHTFLKLSSTEYSLLALLAKHEGKVLTHTFLSEKIWGPDDPDGLKNLRVYIAKIRKKIEPKPGAPVHIHTEAGIGYKFTGSQQTLQ
jgi:two-component system, OmpR family, KDP operon response regulator KdpE